MPYPKVSIITPCYNAERFIKRLLDSVLEQDYGNIEFLIIDDGSTDNTPVILKDYKKKFNKKSIDYKVINKSNGGAASAINKGLEVFSGDYITFIDADDFLKPKSLRQRIDFLESNNDYDAVITDTDVVHESDYNTLIERKKIKPGAENNLFESMIAQDGYTWTPAYLLRSKFFLQVNPKRRISEFKAGQNIQLFLPMWHKAKVGRLAEATVTIVSHDDSHSRLGRTVDEHNSRQAEIRDIYVDTLQKIQMPGSEREKYNSIINENYHKSLKRKSRSFTIVKSHEDEISSLYDYDEQKFRDSYVSNLKTANQRQLAAKLVFSAHSLEKGLSNDNFEIGHGFNRSRTLIEILNQYKLKNYDEKHLAYTSTLSVLKEFYTRHINTEYQVEIEAILGSMLDEIRTCTSTVGGADIISLRSKHNNDKKDFRELSAGRFSVRNYADRAVDRGDIADVIGIAMKTPTVCNRQSLHVYEMYDKDVIEAVLKVQGGITYYDTPPALLLITADDNGYVGANERNQGFIDGGLFAMSILYALEYKQLAACPLNAMFNEEKEKMIRGMLDLSDSEKLITFISVGHFNPVSNVCKSFRYPVEYVLSEKNILHEYSINKLNEITMQPKKQQTDELSSLYVRLKKAVRVRTRLRALKHKTRVRTRYREYMKNRFENRQIELKDEVLKDPDGAILTLTGYFNYGNILQRYALQKFLLNNGHKFVSYAQEPLDTKDKSYDRLRNTIRFVEKRIIRKPFDSKDNYSAYVAGSDQIWRKWGLATEDKSFDSVKYYLFDFVTNNDAKRIAYAASFGHEKIESANLTESFMKSVKPLAQQMTAVSMRETSGVKIVKDYWDIECTTAVDPTMLMTSRDYNLLIKYSTAETRESKQVFGYILDNSDAGKQLVNKLAENHSLSSEIIYLYDKAKTLPSVEQWLKNIRDADLVITDSFHGMVFSILFNTPFIVLENHAGGVSRIEGLLAELGLDERLLSGDKAAHYKADKLPEIDWGAVNKKVADLRANSGSWLLDEVRK